MKKGLKTKLGLSVASLALLAGTLSTTTYAWFTTNATAAVDQISASAKASTDSIYMSTNGINFYDSVSVTATGVALDAVTFDDGYKNLSSTAATITSTPSADGKSVTCAGDVLQFTIYFKTTATTDITFEAADFATTGAAEFTLLADYGSNKAGTNYTSYLTNASRLAVLPYGEVTVTDGVVAAGTKGTRATYTTVNADNATANKGNASADNDAISYYESIMGEISASAPTCPTETSIANPAKGNVIVSTAAPGKIYKVEFTFYVEGYDADCFDAILGQGCTIDLEFGLKSTQDAEESGE